MSNISSKIATVGLAVATVISTAFSIPQSASAGSIEEYGANCDLSGKNPVTVVTITNGDKRTSSNFLRWDSNAFVAAGYDNPTRCKHVSQRLDRFLKSNGKLVIIPGSWNGRRSLCLSDRINGKCIELLYTMKNGQDSKVTLRKLQKIDPTNQKNNGLSESNSIDVLGIIKK